MHKIIVSDHALLRYIERVVGVDTTSIKFKFAKTFRKFPNEAELLGYICKVTNSNRRKMKKAMCTNGLYKAVRNGATQYREGSAVYYLRGNVVVTVLTTSHQHTPALEGERA
jgi:hypothetical protein